MPAGPSIKILGFNVLLLKTSPSVVPRIVMDGPFVIKILFGFGSNNCGAGGGV